VVFTKFIDQQSSLQCANIVPIQDNIIYSYNNKLVYLDILSDRNTPCFIYDEGNQIIQEQVQDYNEDEDLKNIIDDSLDEKESQQERESDNKNDDEDEEDIDKEFDNAAKQFVYNNTKQDYIYDDNSDQDFANNQNESDYIEV
ncbi:hypothetical protein IMG5_163260, partial [Ichthyophthirius multifiliis]